MIIHIALTIFKWIHKHLNTEIGIRVVNKDETRKQKMQNCAKFRTPHSI